MTLNFFVAQVAPGGPVEQMIAKMMGSDVSQTFSFGGGGFEGGSLLGNPGDGGILLKYKGSQGIDPKFIAEIEKKFGFDKPIWERYLLMLKQYIRFDFGNSYFRDRPVIDILLEKWPVSLSLGLWATLIVYLISIPLGIAKAVRHGARFDVLTSFSVVVLYAIPSFLFAIMLVVLFAGGTYWSIFPLRGLVSDGFAAMTLIEKIKDYAWHMVLPTLALTVVGFAHLTLLCKNTFLEEINKLYVTAARAKGLTERRVLWGHVFRNAMLLVVAGIPSGILHILFTGSILVEVIFSLDGIGLLGFEAARSRDFPIVFGTLYLLSMAGLVMHLVSDLLYRVVDPRIHFDRGSL